MNEQERRVNQAMRALDEAHRTGRLSRDEYRARRRALLGSLCDSHGVTARNALTPAAAAPPRGPAVQRVAAPSMDMAAALFPGRRSLAWKLWLAAVAALGLCALALYGAVRMAQG